MEKETKSFVNTAVALFEENMLLKKRMKRERIITHVAYIIGFVIAFFILRDCSGKKDAQIAKLTTQINSLKDALNHKCILSIEHGTDYTTGKTGYHINIAEVRKNDEGSDYAFIEDKYVIKQVPCKAKANAPVPCPDDEIGDYVIPDTYADLVNQIAERDSLLNSSVYVCMEKSYRQDSTVTMVEKKVPLKYFLKHPYSSLYYQNTYIEYLPNIYREKAEGAFERAIVSGIFSVASYAISEGIKTPIFVKGADNSEAQKLHDQIFGLRVVCAVTGAYSAFEFVRIIHLHKMEGKFIINPTKIGLTINLDKPVKK